MTDVFACSHCGRELPLSRRTEFDGQVLCRPCLEDLTVVCDHCEVLIWRRNDHGDSTFHLGEGNRFFGVALFLSDQEVQELTWREFMTGCTAPQLVQYLKERRLYVNDITEGEEEL